MSITVTRLDTILYERDRYLADMETGGRYLALWRISRQDPPPTPMPTVLDGVQWANNTPPNPNWMGR